MRSTSARVSLSLVLFMLGFLVVAQLRAQNADQGLSALSVAELTELVANVTTRNNQLRDEIGALDRQHEAVAAAAERGDTSAGQIRADLNRILGWSGVLAVSGPGVVVSVRGAVPGDAFELLLNELRNAGAEAMAIEDIRVVPGVIATGPENAVLVGGLPLVDPVRITAIGAPQVLAGSLSRAGGPIAQLTARFPGVDVSVTTQDLLRVPATDHDLAPALGRPRL